MNKKIIIIFFMLLSIFLIINLKEKFRPKYSKKKILGFQICGIGRGHLTQAQTVYNVLIKKYNIPVVIIYGRNSGFSKNFSRSKVIYKKIYTDKESISKMDRIKVIKDFFSYKNTLTYEKTYGINLWFNFLVADIFNFRTKQIHIANQLLLNIFEVYAIFLIQDILSYTYFATMMGRNNFSHFEIPPLIDIENMNRDKLEKNTVLCYSVSGNDFPKTLIEIAKKNSNYTFHYFLNYELNMEMPKNIILHEQSKTEFKKYLVKSEIVLSTAGNQINFECMYNNIPLAIMACDKEHIEQINNVYKYNKKFKYASLMNKNLNLEKLKNKNVKHISDTFKKKFENREEKILNLCNV